MDPRGTYEWVEPNKALPNHTEMGGEIVLTWFRPIGQIRLGMYTRQSGWYDIILGEESPTPSLWCMIKPIPGKFTGENLLS